MVHRNNIRCHQPDWGRNPSSFPSQYVHTGPNNDVPLIRFPLCLGGFNIVRSKSPIHYHCVGEGLSRDPSSVECVWNKPGSICQWIDVAPHRVSCLWLGAFNERHCAFIVLKFLWKSSNGSHDILLQFLNSNFFRERVQRSLTF